MTPTTALQALPSNLTQTDIAQCYREATGATRFSETDEIFARLIERRVHELAALSAPAQDAQAGRWTETDEVQFQDYLARRERRNKPVESFALALGAKSIAARTQPATPAQDAAATVPGDGQDGDSWEANVAYLLSSCPYTVRQRPGGGPEDLKSTLVVTFRGMQMRLQGDPMFSKSAAPTAQAAQPAGMVPLTDAIHQLLAKHSELLEASEHTYFELAYTRQTGFMAWITDKPLASVVVNPDRKVIVSGQGNTADEACADALQKLAGITPTTKEQQA